MIVAFLIFCLRTATVQLILRRVQAFNWEQVLAAPTFSSFDGCDCCWNRLARELSPELPTLTHPALPPIRLRARSLGPGFCGLYC